MLLAASGLGAAEAWAHGTNTPGTALHGAKQQFSIAVPNDSAPLTVAMRGSASSSSSGDSALLVTVIVVGALTLAALGLAIAGARRRG